MFLISLIILFLLLIIPRVLTLRIVSDWIYPLEEAPEKPAAVVFGAGLNPNGTPTTVLRDRVFTAAQLYKQGKVDKILMSGDNRFIDYNEPGAMKSYALELNIPEDDIILDFAGRRTYDTCYRTGKIFQVNDVILVTQSFHLPRALFTCNSLGIQAVGVSADQRTYRRESLFFWNLREIAATFIAWIQVYITRPEPVLGNPEPIFPEN